MGYVQYNYDAGMSLQWYEFTVVRVDFGTSWLYNILLFLNHRYPICEPPSLCNYVGFASFSKQYLRIITHCIKNILCILYICMKVETSHYSYIMTASLIGRALILVKMSVETFKTHVHLFFFIGNIMCLTSQWPIIFSVRVRARDF
jgi:hypothetical protein